MPDNLPLEQCRILVVDDNPANVLLVVRLLEFSGFKNLRSTYDSEEVITIYREWSPDLIVLDLHMPKMSGFQVLAELNTIKDPEEYLPVLIFTADVTADSKKKALEAGAADFLTKPGDAVEITLRVQNFLRMRLMTQRLAEQNRFLEERVRERTQELEAAHLDVVARLARTAEYRDDDTGEHAKRVGVTAAKIAAEMGIEPERVDVIRLAATLHDLGKVGVPDAVLLKPGRLTEEEFAVIRRHTIIGAEVLRGSPCHFLQVAEPIALYHHERWDGSGYPQGLRGEEIPLEARIVAVADVFDALCSERPYKTAITPAAALEEIRASAGTQFDPQVVAAFERVIELPFELPESLAA